MANSWGAFFDTKRATRSGSSFQFEHWLRIIVDEACVMSWRFNKSLANE